MYVIITWCCRTQFYFQINQKCKRYFKLAFKYLVLFRQRNVSLVPWEEASEHSNIIKNHDSSSAPERITEIDHLRSEIHPDPAHSLTSTTVHKWKRCLQRLIQTRPEEHIVKECFDWCLIAGLLFFYISLFLFFDIQTRGHRRLHSWQE